MISDPTLAPETHLVDNDSASTPCTDDEASAEPIVEQGKLFRNLSANAVNLGVTALAQVWFTAYLIHYLGVAGYGLVPLTTQVVSYMSLITLAVNSSVARYLTISLERRQNDEANRIFNTSLFGSILIGLVLLGPGLFAAAHADFVFAVPHKLVGETRLLFALVVVTFVISTIATSFDVASYCTNRFDLRNAVQVGGIVVRVGLVVVLFAAFVPSLWHVGAGMLVAAILSGVASFILCKRLIPVLSVSPKQLGWETLRKLMGTGWWITVNQVGTLLLVSIDLLIVNRMFSPRLAGHYAALLQWPIALRAAAGAVSGVFGPMILYHYAHDNIDGLVRYTRRSIKLLGILMVLPTGLICGFSRPLLQVWLGAEAARFAPLLALMTIHLALNLGYLPLQHISMATNRVRVPGIVQVIAGVLNVVLALLFVRAGWGLYGVAGASAIVLTVRNIVFTPIYSAYIINRRYDVFFRELLPLTFTACALGAACWHLSTIVALDSWIRLLAAAMGVSAVYVAIVCPILTTRDERQSVLGNVPILCRIFGASKSRG